MPIEPAWLQNEAAWLSLINQFVHGLEEATRCPIQIGEYSCDVELPPPKTSYSLGLSVRSSRPHPKVKSDSWEARVCFTGNQQKNWSDAYVFPLLDGERVKDGGQRVSVKNKPDEFLWYINQENGWVLAESDWVINGWEIDGYGEWECIRKPGDLYCGGLKCEPTQSRYQSGETVLIRIKEPFRDYHGTLITEPQRFSLIHANRNRENTNSAPWGVFPPRSSSPHVQTLTWRDCEPNGDLLLDLSQFNIRHDWIPGKYHVALRSQLKFVDWDWSSGTSEPFQIVIVP